MRIAISFDYDSPAGYRASFHNKDISPSADLKGTNALLRVLDRYSVSATFGIVGNVALGENPPEHCAEQIRQIHRAGHEVASHSMHHRFIPPMTSKELVEDVRESRGVLEKCIDAPVVGFIPPFNRPMQFPQRGALSVSEFLGLHGRGRGLQTVGSMLEALHSAGYQWSRISYSNTLTTALRWLGARRDTNIVQPFLYRRMVAIPLHCGGFGNAARTLVDKYAETDITLTVYGHPNQAFEANDENAEMLEKFLRYTTRERRSGHVEFCTMQQVAATVNRSGHGVALNA